MTAAFREKYGPWALVTGASSGIGKSIARELASRGLNVVLAARREEVLKQVAAKLEADCSVSTRTLAIDFGQPNATETLLSAVNDLDIGLVVPNAGVERTGDFLAIDLEQHLTQNHLNITVPTEIAHAFGRKLAHRSSGGILLVSSLIAYQATPTFASYSAGKSYILLLGEALNVELAPLGIDVTVLSPGLTSTEMVDNMPVNWRKMPLLIHTPEKTARTGVDALGRKASVVPGLLNKFYAFENRLLPRIFPTKLFGFLLNRATTEQAPRWQVSK